MNKSNLSIMLFFSVLGLTFFTYCKGSAGKKAATEALEFIEKKAASKAASSVEREAGQVERAIEEKFMPLICMEMCWLIIMAIHKL